jgi:hypothetical protein
MAADSMNLRGIFPLTVDPWDGQPRPEYFHPRAEPKHRSKPKDRGSDDQVIAVSHNGARRIEVREIGNLLVQVAEDNKVARATVIGRRGCIDGLKVALARIRGGEWSNGRIAEEVWKGGASIERMLVRLNAGARISISFMIRLAQEYGLDPEDLAFLHTALSADPGRRKSKADPIANLRRQREEAMLKALACFPVPLYSVTEPTECEKLACDLLKRGTRVHIERRWSHDTSVNAETAAAKVIRFCELLDKISNLEPIARAMRPLSTALLVATCELATIGIATKAARYIGVRRDDTEEGDYRSRCPERRVVVLLESAPGKDHYVIDLRQDNANRPSTREDDFYERDQQAALRSIRRDMAWCGHWEGRWFPVWPQPAPSWLDAYALGKSLMEPLSR